MLPWLRGSPQYFPLKYLQLLVTAAVLADLSIPRVETSKPSFSDVLSKPPLVQGAHDPSVLGLVPIVSKPTSVIVSNQTLLPDTSIQASTSMTETFAEQTINAAGNR